MRYLLLLSAVISVLADGDQPVVYSYSSAASDSGSYEGTTTEAPADEESTEKPESSDKELLQPRFFAYSDKYGSAQSEPQSSEIEKDEKEENEPTEDKFTKGGGHEHNMEHDISEGHKGGKGYKGYHKFAKGQKGVHDKESHKGKYSDTKGVKGKKKKEGAHFGVLQHAEKGRKAAKYGESGEHNKGHHTKGEHKIHKKDEYLKKHEFYDEHHEGGEHEKNGGFHQLVAKKKGGKKRRGRKKTGENEKRAGKKGRKKKAKHTEKRKGHDNDLGSRTLYRSTGKSLRKSSKRKNRHH
ncbi:glutamic acid-rich protein-like [Halyomorpha halys]|uniref:glutamic acid-rich protein-like n=1 Tax=Halyomorpha halys TaxID=286706 RepID=UPI0006D4E3F9|nr:glutamic acid-rich protein-like [Halyomorpha halys]